MTAIMFAITGRLSELLLGLISEHFCKLWPENPAMSGREERLRSPHSDKALTGGPIEMEEPLIYVGADDSAAELHGEPVAEAR